MLRSTPLACCLSLVCVALASTALTAHADVTKFEITSRAPVGTSGYEKIVGIAWFAVNPKVAADGIIADIDRAPVNAAGQVEFSSDVYILRPLDAAQSNRVGFTIVWVGWEFDIRRASDAVAGAAERGAGMAISIPSARGVSDVIRASFTPNDDGRQTVGDLGRLSPRGRRRERHHAHRA